MQPAWLRPLAALLLLLWVPSQPWDSGLWRVKESWTGRGRGLGGGGSARGATGGPPGAELGLHGLPRPPLCHRYSIPSRLLPFFPQPCRRQCASAVEGAGSSGAVVGREGGGDGGARLPPAARPRPPPPRWSAHERGLPLAQRLHPPSFSANLTRAPSALPTPSALRRR